MTKQSQDSFMVGKSKFRQCLEPSCIYATYQGSAANYNWCKKHMVEQGYGSIVSEDAPVVTEKATQYG